MKKKNSKKCFFIIIVLILLFLFIYLLLNRDNSWWWEYSKCDNESLYFVEWPRFDNFDSCKEWAKSAAEYSCNWITYCTNGCNSKWICKHVVYNKYEYWKVGPFEETFNTKWDLNRFLDGYKLSNWNMFCDLTLVVDWTKAYSNLYISWHNTKQSFFAEWGEYHVLQKDWTIYRRWNIFPTWEWLYTPVWVDLEESFLEWMEKLFKDSWNIIKCERLGDKASKFDIPENMHRNVNKPEDYSIENIDLYKVWASNNEERTMVPWGNLNLYEEATPITDDESENIEVPILITEDGVIDEMDQFIEVQLENWETEIVRQRDLWDAIHIN